MKAARWIVARFASVCSCGREIKKGDRILYHPASPTAQCEDCGAQYARDLAADNFDAVNNGCL